MKNLASPCTRQKEIKMAEVLDLNLPSPLEKVNYPLFEAHQVNVYLKRDDLIHSEISGNKWRKLKLNLEKFKLGKYEQLLTFGGAYSNHISATAALGRILEIPTIGIIRGDELSPSSNQTLQKAAQDGMELIFVNREEYSWRYETEYKNQLREKFGNVLVIEEGGANFYGMMGCTEIVSEIPFQPDYYVLPAGTGTTTSGILFATETSHTIAIAASNDVDGILEEISSLLEYAGLTEDEVADKLEMLTLTSEFTFGGYGKTSPELITFINDFYTQTEIKLDQVYTGKMMYGLCEFIKTGKIAAGKTVVAVHTGGLQGTNSILDRLLFL